MCFPPPIKSLINPNLPPEQKEKSIQLIEANKDRAREQLLRIQVLMARRTVK